MWGNTGGKPFDPLNGGLVELPGLSAKPLNCPMPLKDVFDCR